MSTPETIANPGPSWGYRTIAFWEKWLPGPLCRLVLGIGTFIGLLSMPAQRRHSRDYWAVLTGRQPTLRQQYRHFRSFMDSLILKLRAGRGLLPEFRFAADAAREAFLEICREPGPVLFGTFHVGHSDMMGCMLRDFDRPVAMVRNRVGNSMDTDVLASTFGENLSFLWINDPREFIFQLKETLQAGISVGLQCDRVEYSSRNCCFEFLGKKREFPVTIYLLADLFRCPVVYSYTGPLERNGTIEVHTTPVYRPGPDRADNTRRAHQHFQSVLSDLEAHLRKHPTLWFNFSPLNPVCKETAPGD